MTKVIRNNKLVKKVDKQAEKVVVLKSKKSPFRPDALQTNKLITAGRKATLRAVRVTKALGLTMTYLENGVLYKEYANGERVVLKTKTNTVKTKFKKGTILNAR